MPSRVSPVDFMDAGDEEDGSENKENTCQRSEKEDEEVLHVKKAAKKQSGLFGFSNSEAIKEKVRSAKVMKKEYNVNNMYWEEGYVQWLAKHPTFENCTLTVIVINAFWISVDTDGNTAETMLDAKTVYVIADSMFFIYFSIELIVRFLAFKRKVNCLKDGWFKFDATLVFLYAFDPFIIALLAKAQGGGGLDLPTSVLRLCRLARLSRLVRMLRSLPELMVMIKGMVTASASVGYTLGLLIIITYVFAIAMRNLVPKAADYTKGEPEESIEFMYFSSVPEAMHNLIIYGTFLDALSDFILAIKEQSPSCLILAWIYIALASLTVMNMLIGVLCEVISAVACEEKESMMVDKVNEKFGEIVKHLDENSDGNISWDEFKEILTYPEALRALESVNVDAESMVDMAEDFFFEDGVQVAVTFDEFMLMLLDLRGGQTAQVKDVMSLGKRFTQKFQKMGSRMDTMEEKLDQILDHVIKLA